MLLYDVARAASEQPVILLSAGLLSYIILTCIYRRFFHPLAHVPGPFLSAVTKLYQSYYNRRYYLQIEKLHAQYGPIVRITPDEVHIADPEHNSEYYDKSMRDLPCPPTFTILTQSSVHHVGSKYSKSPNFYNALCVPHSSFGTLSNEAHRIKRAALNPMFSKQKVLDLESIVQEKVEKVCQRMQAGLDNGTQVDLYHCFRAVSVDVISEFAFDDCYDLLDKEDIGATFFEMARGIGPALWVFQQLPTMQRLALKIPPWLAPKLSTPLGYVTRLQGECVRKIEVVKQQSDLGRQTIFTTLLSGQDKPEGYVIPTTERLKDEAYSVLAAAADTTGNAMTVAAYNVLADPEIYDKLASELSAHFPDRMEKLSYVELERLPYLVGFAILAALFPILTKYM